ncbi:hypothetical protein K2Y00_02800 [Patescibacteria group bacterium]|nr:hypothetical protein [Patescibacteria group bacterium]
MSANTRRILIIAVAVAVVIAVLGIIWAFFFRSGPDLQVGGGDPFGNAGSGDTTGGDVPGVLDSGINYSSDAGTLVAPRLVRITDAPVAYGSVAMYIPEVPAATTTDGSVTPAIPPDVEIRFVERQSGNVYAYRAYARSLTRLSNQTVPGVHEAVWLSDGSLAYLRFLTSTTGTEILQTYALPANGDGGYYLEQGIADLAATSSRSVMSLVTSSSGSVATAANADGTEPRTAFSSAITDLAIAFFGRGYLATTRGSASLDGYSFFVSEGGTTWSRIAGPLRGLSAIGSPDGTTALISYVDRGTLTTRLVDMQTRLVTPLPIATLTEKCAFSADSTALYCSVPTNTVGTLPDAWYQGTVSFADRIWKVDLASRVTFMLLDPTEVAEIQLDGVSLAVDPTDDILTFTNRTDGSLWAYDL